MKKKRNALFCISLFCVLAASGMTVLKNRIYMDADGPKNNTISYFYGYNSSKEGPGDEAFQKCLDMSKSQGRPIFLVLGLDSCADCDKFADYVNHDDKGMGTFLGHSGCINAYFRGSSESSPKACKDAWDFVKEVNGSAQCACGKFYLCGVFPDDSRFCKEYDFPVIQKDGEYTYAGHPWKEFYASVKKGVDLYNNELEKHTSETIVTINALYTNGDPRYPGAGMYGYRKTGDGPGDDAFQKCTNLAYSTHSPMILIVGKDECQTCSSLAKNFNLWQRGLASVWKYDTSINAYFRGNDSASQEAYSFVRNVIGVSSPCHTMCCFGVAEDGTQYSTFTSAIMDYEKFVKWKVNQCDEFDEFANQHKSDSPATPSTPTTVQYNDTFLCVNSIVSETTGYVYIPVLRTNNTSNAQISYVTLTDTDGSQSEYTVSFAQGQKVLETSLLFTRKCGYSIVIDLMDCYRNVQCSKIIQCK